jgi:hypothetical protein
MALNLQGYSTPVNDFGGLHQAAESMRRQSTINEAMAQREQSRKNQMGAFLMDYLDPKNFMTGTGYDKSYISGKVGEIMQKGLEHAKMQGADTNSLLGILSEDVNRLSGEINNIKAVKANIEDNLKAVPEGAGYNKRALQEEAFKAAFLGEDGQLKNIGTVDASVPWVSEAVKTNPLGVTNADVFDNVVKDFEPYSIKKSIKRQNEKGGYEKRVSVLKARGVFDYDDEAGEWVTKHEIAKDGDKPIMFPFKGKDGKVTEHPMRMATDDVYDYMIRKPAIADRLRGEVEQFAKNQGIKLDEGQERRIGKMMLYEDLKPLASGSIDDIQETKENPAPRITLNTGGNKTEANAINDLYSRMDAELTRFTDYGEKAPPLNLVAEADGVDIVLDMANKGRNAEDKFKPEDLTVRRADNGQMVVYHKNDYILTLPKVGVNLKVQPNAAAKKQVVAGGKNPAPTAAPKKEMTLAEKMRANKK